MKLGIPVFVMTSNHNTLSC